MNFQELVRDRYSVRSFHDHPVEEKKLRKVLETARLAPSACNFQPWVFIVVKKNRKKLKPGYDKDWFLSAPVVIVVCCDRQKAWIRSDGKKYGDVDVAIAMDHLSLQAAELGLGTCWVGAFNEEKVREALNLPFHLEPVIMTPLGYPNQQPREKSRRSFEEVVKWEKFSE